MADGRWQMAKENGSSVLSMPNRQQSREKR
jgi:hypothetical protein